MPRYLPNGNRWCYGRPKSLGIPGHEQPDLNKFSFSKRSNDNLQDVCKDCHTKLSAKHNPKRYGPNANPESKATMDACDARKRITRHLRRPLWLTESQEEEIRSLYAKRNRMNKRDGKSTWSIDHIIPLQGTTVSGLHVINNLKIVKTLDNLSKSNSWNWETQS